MKNKFGFILVKPQLGENIGSCARSMKNFGFSKLHLVSPKINFPNHKAKATSVGAYDIINKTKVFNETREAISNFDIVMPYLKPKYIKLMDIHGNPLISLEQLFLELRTKA